MATETTLILFKPDAVAQGIVGTVLSRYEKEGFKVRGLKMMELSDELLAEHYSHIADKPFPGGIANRFNPQNEDAHGWNTLEIEERDGRLRVFVNGLLQNEATGVSPEPTTFGLRSEGHPIDFRNLTLEPLPGAPSRRAFKPPRLQAPQ